MSNELIGFDGKPITIKRTGRRTPVDVELVSDGDEHVLKLSANLSIIDDELDDPRAFEQDVVSGIKAWEGEYSVFKNQRVRVTVDVTDELRLTDSVRVIPVTDKLVKMMSKLCKIPLLRKRNNGKLEKLVSEKRSFAVQGLRKWSVHSKKMIYIMDEDGTFSDHEEIKNIAKHEFGHVLGLGDLYRSIPDGLMGVRYGKYKDLDVYRKELYKSEYYYDLVMCNNGAITDNDIEMVILAFSENEMQHYQENYANKEKEQISSALGRGN